MKSFKNLAIAAMMALAITALASAGTASATTLEIGGTAQNKAVSVSVSLASGTSTIFKDNLGVQTGTCTTSSGSGESRSPFTATAIWIWWNSWLWENCTDTTKVLKAGHLHIIWTSGTNGEVSMSDSEWTIFATALNASAVCKTGTGTSIGTITGVKSGKATMDVSTNKLNCGILGTATWTGTYTVTSPEGLGVVS